MKLLKKITILLCFLSLIAFVSCSAEDKSGVKEKDNADGTEITGGGKSGNSGTGGTSGTGGGTETTVIGKFPPPAGTYKDKDGKNNDTEVTIEGEKTKMGGLQVVKEILAVLVLILQNGRKQPKTEKILNLNR